MWKPNDVIDQHKCSARAVWSALLAVMCGYTIWVIYGAIKKRAHPSTTTTLSNSLYPFPDVAVCFGEEGYYGCAAEDREGIEACVDSALTSAYYYVYSDESTDPDPVNATRSDYDAMNLDNADDDWEEVFSETVLLYIEDSAPTQVPYDRLVEGNITEYMVTTMTIGLTKRNYIGKASDQLYSVLTMSSYTLHSEEATIYGVNGYLGLSIALSPNSLITITEVDPVQVSTLLGTIGGFWEIVILVWGLFFVAAYRSAPSLKARSLPGKKRPVPTPENPAEEAPPPWDNTHGDTVEGRQQQTRRWESGLPSASWKRPVPVYEPRITCATPRPPPA